MGFEKEKEEEEIEAYMIYGVKLDAIEGRKIVISNEEYELADNSLVSPEDLIDFLGETVDVAIVNGKVYNVRSSS